MELIEIKDKQKWEGFVAGQVESTVLQSWAWGEFLAALGRPIKRFFVLHQGDILARVLIVKIIFTKNFYYLYVPRGPVFRDGLNKQQRLEILRRLCQQAVKVAGFEKALFLRIDPALSADYLNLHQLGFKKANKESQPHHTLLVDLTRSEEDLLNQMKPKGRYNIKVAEKRGLQVMLGTSENDLEKFYEILAKTASRNNFSAHPRNYYFNLWRALYPQQLRLYLAEHENKIIAAILVTLYGNRAIYLHGASDYEHRQLMAPHLLQWQAMKEAKSNGYISYDLWGVAPSNATDNHPWSGLTRFKESFGGEFQEYVGTYDYIYRPAWHRLFNIVRNLKRKFR